ncbi:alpha/beta fold hydrolase [Methylobacterium sp. WL30]|uniref:alpha/beta hydrolase n=2 Tax=Methylobacterium TaxID=407 RepID=UPI0011C7DFB0|nr:MULTISPECIES: alpha/beta hydrolase [unclassified Methylobacterium]TXN25237.1 alpha/beta fold hydrolase [Methylobacterium sp. WL93]TXN47090.1 alpha/beta fold hydrolase [Methylobacterium sp. WL119]TXN67649.1 alpha/beta fold hydrolase [Methylobacterium sp. WL30]
MMHAPLPQRLSPLEAEPVVIDGLFGWFSPGIGRRGVILCGATGFEQLSAHRPWRTLAGRIAATGCATLRFDYPGEGDSADAGAGTLAAWRDAVRRAVRFLREEAGVTEVVLVGLRLGATLAALVAEEGGVDRLVLMAPCRTGRGYLREMKLRAPAVNQLSDGTAPAEMPGRLSVGGFPIGPELAADLARIDLASATVRPAPEILILGAETDALAKRYAALGAAVTAGALPGLAQLVGNPLFSEAPEAAFAEVVAFATAGALPRPNSARAVAAPAHLAGDGWREEAVRFGPGLFGIHTRPTGPSTGAPTVLFIAAGLSAHSGWGRQATRMARVLAAEGVPSLRMDLAGVGDSADRPGGASPMFSADTLDDFRHALDHLEAQGASRVVLVGNCSGAYAAFQAAWRDHRVAGALLANLYCFDWHPDDDVDAVVRRTVGSAATYAALLRRGSTWRRLLKGEVGVRAIGSVLLRRGLCMAERRWKALFRPAPEGGSVARRIAAMRRRGAPLRLVYAVGDPGIPALRRHVGRTPERAARRLGAPVAIIAGTDHNLATPAAQAELATILRDLVATVVASRP